jgi:hypothetical protein
MSVHGKNRNHGRNDQPEKSLYEEEHETPEAKPFDPTLSSHLLISAP